MIGYDPWHQPHDDDCECSSCQKKKQYEREAFNRMMQKAGGVIVQQETRERQALIDIAHDCGSLEAAQRRAKEGLQ